MTYLEWKVTPGIGWGPLLFGLSVEEVIAAFESQGISYRVSQDDAGGYLAINCDAPECLCNFTLDGQRRLAQIVVEDFDFAIGEDKLILLSLTEALIALGVRDYSDTLWIKSLGVGLVMNQGSVTSVALRRHDGIPESNCGPLLESHLQLALSVDLDQQLGDARPKESRKWTRDSTKAVAISVMILASLALVAGLYLLVRSATEKRAMWLAAPSLVATVVATQPAGDPFPDSYTLEYVVPGQPPRRFHADWQSVRHNLKDDKTIEIRYLENAPDRAMTMTQVFENNVVNQVPTILIAVMIYFFGMIFLGILCR